MTMNATARRPGRPKQARTAQNYYDGKLYALLFDRMPHHVLNGRLWVRSLAAALEISTTPLYRWMTEDRLTAKQANRLIAESRGKLKPEDMTQFLFN